MAAGKYVYVKAKKTLPYQAGHWSDRKKQEAICMWVTGMPMSQISVELNVPLETVKSWRTKPWWDDIAKDLRSDDKQQLDAKLTKILDKTLSTMMDRLEEGEYIYDQKTGKVKRTPVKLRDATVAMNTVMDKRQLIRREPTKITEQSSSADQLKNLADQFTAFVTGQAIKAEPMEKLVNEFNEDSVEQNEDGSYTLRE